MISWLFGTKKHHDNVRFKQKQREDRIAELPQYAKPLSAKETGILNESVADVVKLVKAGELKPREVLNAYGKKALTAHKHTNALTEVMLSDAETWADHANLNGPLAGFPVSLKDPFIVGGYDAMAGYSALSNKPQKEDGAIARLLKDAGAVPYVKTNVPITMMAIEGYNDIFGRTTNPHNPGYAPGGSSQGEGALIGFGGSRIGIGTDIGGSVRVPAAWSGICSLRMTTFRFPMDGDISCDMGFEGVQYVASPMAKTIGDLRYFTDSVMSMKPWNYDYHLIPLPWRAKAKVSPKSKVGVLKLDDLLPLTPAQNRALETTAKALRAQGCEVVEFKLPEPSAVYDRNVFRLYQVDGLNCPGSKIIKGETNDAYVEYVMKYVRRPRFLRKTWEFILRLFGFKEKAQMLEDMDTFSVPEYFSMVTERERLRRGVREAWDKAGIDFLITAPHPSPAIPNAAPLSFYAILYTSLFNLLDYPAGILPVGRVSKTLDQLPKTFKRSDYNWQANVSFDTYDATKMDGLPISVQVVGKRYFDEETMSAMELVVDSLKNMGVVYE